MIVYTHLREYLAVSRRWKIYLCGKHRISRTTRATTSCTTQNGIERDVSSTPNESMAPSEGTPATQPPELDEEFVQILLSGTARARSASESPDRSLPSSTQSRRTKYKPRTRLSRCSKCGKARTPDSHKQFYGNWFCVATSTVNYEVWLRALKEKRHTERRCRSEADVPTQVVPIPHSPIAVETSRSCEQKPATLATPGIERQFVFILPRGTPPTAKPQTLPLPRKRAAQEAAGLSHRKKYKPRTGLSICNQCDKPRTADAHKQYYGNVYCAAASAVSHEVWLQAQKEKGYGRRAKKCESVAVQNL